MGEDQTKMLAKETLEVHWYVQMTKESYTSQELFLGELDVPPKEFQEFTPTFKNMLIGLKNIHLLFRETTITFFYIKENAILKMKFLALWYVHFLPIIMIKINYFGSLNIK